MSYGAILRSPHDKDNPYVMVNKQTANDKALSWQARGMLFYLLSKTDNWTVRVTDLAAQSPLGINGVRTILKELEAAGYLLRKQVQDADGQFFWETHVYETPQSKPEDKTIYGETAYGADVRIQDTELRDIQTGVPVCGADARKKPVPKKPRKTSPTKKEQRQVNLRLADVFCQEKRVRRPLCKTAADWAAANTLWWKPLAAIRREVRNDEQEAAHVIRLAVQRLNNQGMTFSDPLGILKTAKAVAAERALIPKGESINSALDPDRIAAGL